MSQPVPEHGRPPMRRKSSAQNLLSSFKSNNTSTSPSLPSGSIPTAPGYVFTAPSSQSTTPTASTTHSRDLDSQSLHSDGVSNSLGGAGSPSLAQGTSIDALRELVHKRIITLTYIRSMHEGRSHWFHTILITRADLDRAFTNNDMKKRSFRYAMLGMSLSNLLEMVSAPDLLRGLTNIMSEFDQAKEETDKPKMRFIWKNAKTSEGASEGTYLFAHHIPFALDYHETLLSLLDVMSEVYNKILKLLGPSPFPQNQHYMGPLGMLSPHPGVSYLFSESTQTSQNPMTSPNHNQLQGMNSGTLCEPDMNSSLWNIANSSSGISSGPAIATGGIHSYPSGNSNAANWSGSWGDMLIKSDSKIKKITTNLLKELDQLARAGIKDELASLDPLLRNMTTVSEDAQIGKLGPEFDVLLM